MKMDHARYNQSTGEGELRNGDKFVVVSKLEDAIGLKFSKYIVAGHPTEGLLQEVLLRCEFSRSRSLTSLGDAKTKIQEIQTALEDLEALLP